MARRFAQFLFFIGMMLLFVFWAGQQSAEQTNVLPLLFCGSTSLLFGALLYWRTRPERVESERFRTLRKLIKPSKDPKKMKESE
jgi:predicted membrane channel-forming protein YqfA (hemolysin III family)